MIKRILLSLLYLYCLAAPFFSFAAYYDNSRASITAFQASFPSIRRNPISCRKERGKLQMAQKAKDIVLADNCRNHLLKGIEQVSDIVRVTLGPRGRNILLEKEYGSPIIVNDGVTIARHIHLKDKGMNAGAKLVQEVATTSDDKAGDGTTSTTILTAEIVKQGVKYVNEGHNPIPIQKGIHNCAKLLMEEVKRLAVPVEGYNDLLNIATVATSGNARMGENIALSFSKLGRNAAVVLEENPALEDTQEFTEGYTFERGWANPYFLIGEDKDAIEWSSPHIIVCEHKIESAQAMLPILEHFVKTKEPLVIIAEDFGQDAMQALLLNKMRGLLKVVAVKAPSFGERRKDYLRDIAIATNSTFISKDLGNSLEELTLSMLGHAKSVVVKKERTSILTLPSAQNAINERLVFLQKEAEKSTSKFDREKLTERMAALSGGIARIMIGAATETEQKEKRMRYEDALSAVRAAVETGYVPGGGVTYLALSSPAFVSQVMDQIEDMAHKSLVSVESDDDKMIIQVAGTEEMESEIELQKAGARIVLDAMSSITKQIATNAGVNGEKIVATIMNSGKKFGFGWNAKTNQFGNMLQQGVIDPAKVIISAIDHSTSVAGLVLTTEGMMVDHEDEKKEESQPAMPMM
ncbi:putative chaperonin cpn60 [Cardiosporidium cionae]|uniref:Chaperonin cpn60 n=1 Tax=Cardiosporidium cionae TaxID=476202 RepID=A0ABQ7J654_9APIC|nr:putative chaperonin cpn60 [Cardiosporidium cionae]|eukprot:KAF8819457.1 putative chaperonin cpn60 [Cardiosporidium cionae]